MVNRLTESIGAMIMRRMQDIPSPRDDLIAVIIPCYNEEAAIGKVIADFKSALPTATIYVCDNN